MISDWGDIATMTAPTASLLATISAHGFIAVTGADPVEDFSVALDRAAAWALPYAGTLITNIDQTTHDTINELVTATMANPDASLDDLAAAIQDNFDGMSDWRSELIARTETAHAAAHGDVEGFRETDTNYVEISDGTDFDEECLVGETLVGATGIRAAFVRYMEGEVVSLRTATGEFVTLTANHPVLTTRGWVASGLLHEGDDVIRSGDAHRLLDVVGRAGPYDHHVPARVDEIVRLALEAPSSLVVSKPTRRGDFHGDGRESEVHAVATYRVLRDRSLPSLLKEVAENALVLPGKWLALASAGAQGQSLLRPMRASGGDVGSQRPPYAFGGTDARGLDPMGFRVGVDAQPVSTEGAEDGARVTAQGLRDHLGRSLGRFVARMRGYDVSRIDAAVRPRLSDFVPERPEATRESAARDREHLAQAAKRHPGLVEPTRLVQVERKPFSGHVYNLHTTLGWYTGNGIVLHNCATADGQVWSLDYYEANDLEHPACGRSASAISDDEARERGVDQGDDPPDVDETVDTTGDTGETE